MPIQTEHFSLFFSHVRTENFVAGWKSYTSRYKNEFPLGKTFCFEAFSLFRLPFNLSHLVYFCCIFQSFALSFCSVCVFRLEMHAQEIFGINRVFPLSFKDTFGIVD